MTSIFTERLNREALLCLIYLGVEMEPSHKIPESFVLVWSVFFGFWNPHHRFYFHSLGNYAKLSGYAKFQHGVFGALQQKADTFLPCKYDMCFPFPVGPTSGSKAREGEVPERGPT